MNYALSCVGYIYTSTQGSFHYSLFDEELVPEGQCEEWQLFACTFCVCLC